MSAENVAIVRSIYDALATGDIPTVVNALSPDVVWNEAESFPYADGNPYVGPEAVLSGVFARLATEWDGFGALMPDFIDGGDKVVVTGRYVGTYPATGKPMNPQALHLWTLRDGKVVSFQQYVDTLAVAKAMGKA
ncbi:MAG: nuclear transport factor 2 family protein [Sphingobium sp.]|nr:nuclear transport factor 2 family protein [Sphingobium sp.]